MWRPSSKYLYGRTSTFGVSVMPDESELALHTVGEVVTELEHAVAGAGSVGRCIQVRERITACIAMLTAVERAAFDKTDRLSTAKDV
jgi:hypothetical protein